MATKHEVHAMIAVQKFCAISLGYTWTTSPRKPPLMPGTAPFGRVNPWWIAAAKVPISSPKKAPCPVARRQNMPSRKVAKRGALTNANTSWSMSMMLLNRVAA